MLHHLNPYVVPLPDDVRFVTAESTLAVFPVGVSRVCTFIVADEDDFVESDELGIVTSVALNPNDMVVGSTKLLIIDNDGNYQAVHL